MKKYLVVSFFVLNSLVGSIYSGEAGFSTLAQIQKKANKYCSSIYRLKDISADVESQHKEFILFLNSIKNSNDLKLSRHNLSEYITILKGLVEDLYGQQKKAIKQCKSKK